MWIFRSSFEYNRKRDGSNGRGPELCCELAGSTFNSLKVSKAHICVVRMGAKKVFRWKPS